MSKETSDHASPLEQVIVRILERSRRHPVLLRNLQAEIARETASQKTATVDAAIERLVRDGEVLVLGDNKTAAYFLRANLEALKERLCAVVRAHHTKHPAEAGIRKSEIKKQFSETRTMSARRNIDARLFETVLSTCLREGLLVDDEGGIRAREFSVPSRDNDEIAKLEAAISAYLNERPFQKVDLARMADTCRIDLRNLKAVLYGMLRARRLIELEEGRFLGPDEIEAVKRAVAEALSGGRRMRLTEIAAALGRSRTSAQPVLDYLDRIGFTRRRDDLRELA